VGEPGDASTAGKVAERVTVEVLLDSSAWATHLAEQTFFGLRGDPRWIPPVWFYDEVGSALFERITRLEEYYPTETERLILSQCSSDIAERTGATTLAEIGSGTSDKTAMLLDALHAGGTLDRFVPFDCSEAVLRDAALSVAHERPWLEVHAVVGDFHCHLDRLPTEGTFLLAFLGSTIGNLDTGQRKGFLADVRGCLGDDDWFLLGTDLVKSTSRLIEAYDDSSGVTAEFNLNCLRVMNSVLGTDFDPEGFRHRAIWNAAESRIEMHLVAQHPQRVSIDGRGVEVHFDTGEHLRTEISTKFTCDQVADELAAAGLCTVATYLDSAGDFLLSLARPS
jgi:L-histidine N-alpha-methyltransferase